MHQKKCTEHRDVSELKRMLTYCPEYPLNAWSGLHHQLLSWRQIAWCSAELLLENSGYSNSSPPTLFAFIEPGVSSYS